MVSTLPSSGVLQLKVDLDPTFALMTGSTRGSCGWREREYRIEMVLKNVFVKKKLEKTNSQ